MIFSGRILEAIVTTLNEDGSTNISPMGPLVDDAMSQLLLRPFQSSLTFQNLKRTGEGVLHVTDDVELIAQAAVGKPFLSTPPLTAAVAVHGRRLVDCCRWYEFRVVDRDESQPRAKYRAEVVATGRERDFFGFNRAMHAVVEAAILATRIDLLSPDELRAAFERLRPLVEKTAGPKERRAFLYLEDWVRERISARSPQGAE